MVYADIPESLFLLETPLAIQLLGAEEWQAEIIDSKSIEIDGHKVEMTVTVLPEKVRLVKGEGGNRRGAETYKPLHIDDNEGCVSMLRNGREIYYSIIPKLLPDGTSDLDRFIGIEVAFPADLDEYFQVRNVKRGAEPVHKLREEIRRFVRPAVVKARRKIRETWAKTEVKEQKEQPAHTPAVEAYKKMEETAPRGIAGTDLSPEEADLIVEQAAQDLAETLPEDRAKDPEQLQELKRQIQNQTITVIDSSWPGKELFGRVPGACG